MESNSVHLLKLMKYRDLREFLMALEKQDELRRVSAPVSPVLEMTEICDRVLKQGGPAIIFDNPIGFDMPVLGNLFGTPRRVALAMFALPLKWQQTVSTVILVAA